MHMNYVRKIVTRASHAPVASRRVSDACQKLYVLRRPALTDCGSLPDPLHYANARVQSTVCCSCTGLCARGRLMIPRSPSPSEPLLGHSSTRSQATPPSRLRARRARRLVVLLAGPIALVITLFALAESNERTRQVVEPYRHRIDRFLYRAPESALAPTSIPATTNQSRAGAPATRDKDTPVAILKADTAAARAEENTDLAPLPRRKWSKEDKQLRRYAWKTPPIHSSLERMLADLSPVGRPAPLRGMRWHSLTLPMDPAGTEPDPTVAPRESEPNDGRNGDWPRRFGPSRTDPPCSSPAVAHRRGPKRARRTRRLFYRLVPEVSHDSTAPRHGARVTGSTDRPPRS